MVKVMNLVVGSCIVFILIQNMAQNICGKKD